MWAGLVTGVPSGWALCNGNNGTPDLREKFIVCTGALFAVGSEGGSVSHTHTKQYDTHTHTLKAGSTLYSGPSKSNVMSQPVGNYSVPAAQNIPESYRLAYIMKL